MRETNEGEPGTIVLASYYFSRYVDFHIALESLVIPKGTKFIHARGGSSAKNQNVGVRAREGGWVWFIDDDHTFTPDVLLRLLARDKPIVAPLVPMRYPPFELVLYKTLNIVESEPYRVTSFEEEFYTMPELNGTTGLMKVQGLPKAGCLIREDIWSKMKDPWFRIGLLHPDDIEDDKYFMWEVREKLGYDLWCDTDTLLFHLNTVRVGCRRDEHHHYHREISL